MKLSYKMKLAVKSNKQEEKSLVFNIKHLNKTRNKNVAMINEQIKSCQKDYLKQQATRTLSPRPRNPSHPHIVPSKNNSVATSKRCSSQYCSGSSHKKIHVSNQRQRAKSTPLIRLDDTNLKECRYLRRPNTVTGYRKS